MCAKYCINPFSLSFYLFFLSRKSSSFPLFLCIFSIFVFLKPFFHTRIFCWFSCILAFPPIFILHERLTKLFRPERVLVSLNFLGRLYNFFLFYLTYARQKKTVSCSFNTVLHISSYIKSIVAPSVYQIRNVL